MPAKRTKRVIGLGDAVARLIQVRNMRMMRAGRVPEDLESEAALIVLALNEHQLTLGAVSCDVGVRPATGVEFFAQAAASDCCRWRPKSAPAAPKPVKKKRRS